MPVIELTKDTFKDMIAKDDKPVLVDFFAHWCNHCKMQAPILEKFSEKYSDKIYISKLDVDHAEDIAKEYSIFSIPTLGIFKGGKLLKRMESMRDERELTVDLKEYI